MTDWLAVAGVALAAFAIGLAGRAFARRRSVPARRRPNVRRIARRADVASLGNALRYHDWIRDRDGRLVDLGIADRLAAVNALAAIRGAEAAKTVGGAVRDDAVPVRRAAIEALDAWPDESGGSVAARMLAVAAATLADDAEANEAARLLERKAGAPGVAAAFVQAALDAPRLTEAGSSVLLELVSSEPDPEEEHRIVDRLIDLLDSDQEILRERAATLLGWLGPRPGSALVEALWRKEDRRGIAAALGRSGDRRATPALAALLRDPDPDLRRAAVDALGALADPRATEPLLRACDDDDYHVRVSAIQAINRLGSVAVVVAASMQSHGNGTAGSDQLPERGMRNKLLADPTVEQRSAIARIHSLWNR